MASGNKNMDSPQIKLPECLLQKKPVWNNYSDFDMDSDLRKLLKEEIDWDRIAACVPKRTARAQYFKKAIIGQNPIYIPPPETVGHERRWSRWSPRLSKMSESFMYLFTSPSKAPGMLNPFLYVNGRPQPTKGRGARYLLLSLVSHRDRTLALRLFKKATQLIRAEGSMLNEDDMKLQKVLSKTAVEAIPSPGEYRYYAFAAFWCLRAICRKAQSPDEIEKTIEKLIAMRKTAVWSYIQYVLWFLMNQRDSKTVSELLNHEFEAEPSVKISNELFRYYIHIGDFALAEEFEQKLQKQIDPIKEPFEEYIFKIRSGRLKFEQGEIEEANRIFKVTCHQIPKFRQERIADTPMAQYREVITPLLWAWTEIYTDEPPAKTSETILRCLKMAVENDFVDLVMFTIALMGEELIRQEEYAEAYTLWQYLWEAAKYLHHPIAMTKACNGLSECILWLGEDDTTVMKYFDEIYTCTENMPARRCETLLGKAFHCILKGRWEDAEKDVSEVLTTTGKYNLRFFGLIGHGLRLLLEANAKGVGRLILRDTEESELGKHLHGITQYLENLRKISGPRGFFKWKFIRALELLRTNRNVFTKRKV